MMTLHCLARWFERSADNSEPALMLDLLHLYQTRDAITKQAVAANGRWKWIAPSGLCFVGQHCHRIYDGRKQTFLGVDTVKVDRSVEWPS
jgi:hypothetical protein